MKPAPFRYLRARSCAEALDLKAEHGDEAKFLAGGQSLIPTMNFRLAQPAILIDINALSDLDGLRMRDGGLRIGALTRYRRLERDALLAQHQPLVREALPQIAHPQIRNRGTLGGNLAHADPASELPAVVLALGGRLRAQSVRGERWIDATDYFVGALTTALEPDEMLTEIALPVSPPRTGACFLEVARRRGDFALMGVAAVVTLAADGTCADARLTFCGAGDTPVAARGAAAALLGCIIVADDVRAAAALAERDLDPPGNMHAGKAFQRHLVGVLTRRAIATAVMRARQ
ncbi:MAG TPA: xanthine dehydrogenase family protein subunit M [Xanthobacteraceae bacterium]|nr:xanthine dehydrogenase family protein subunit M [Xanthobacteraceae bacterium]